jgi:Fe-S-cluster containining protein
LKHKIPQFEPIGQFDWEGDVRWRFNCTALDKQSGRCKVYDRRPDLCRRYEAGSDALCALYRGAADQLEDYSAASLTV